MKKKEKHISSFCYGEKITKHFLFIYEEEIINKNKKTAFQLSITKKKLRKIPLFTMKSYEEETMKYFRFFTTKRRLWNISYFYHEEETTKYLYYHEKNTKENLSFLSRGGALKIFPVFILRGENKTYLSITKKYKKNLYCVWVKRKQRNNFFSHVKNHFSFLSWRGDQETFPLYIIKRKLQNISSFYLKKETSKYIVVSWKCTQKTLLFVMKRRPRKYNKNHFRFLSWRGDHETFPLSIMKRILQNIYFSYVKIQRNISSSCHEKGDNEKYK